MADDNLEQPSLAVDRFRLFCYDIFHKSLTFSEFLSVKRYLLEKQHIYPSDLDALEDDDRTGVLSAFIRRTEAQWDQRKTLDVLGKAFLFISRPDLMSRCQDMKSKLPTRPSLSVGLFSSLVKSFHYNISFGWFFTCSFLLAALCLRSLHGKTWELYRYYKCTWGGNQSSVMSFTFTTYDMIDADVKDNVEFEWNVLAQKLDLDFLPRPVESRYFLNTNRCIYGDVRVQHSLDNIKPVRGAEIFSVSPDCMQVYYHSSQRWVRYQSARNIICSQEHTHSGYQDDQSHSFEHLPIKDDH